MRPPISRELVRLEVLDTIAGFSDDFDVEGIVDEIAETYGLVWPDTIPSAEYWALVERHDTTVD